MSVIADPLSLLMLSELRGVGPYRAHRVFAYARGREMPLATVLAQPAPELARDCRLNEWAMAQLTSRRAAHQEHCQDLASRLGDWGAVICHIDEARYPANWRAHARPAPPVVFWHGNRQLIDAPSAAVLNSRTMTAAAVSATVRVVHRLARDGYTLVTGSMKSTYRIAAVAARAAATPRAIVLDRGLFVAFPQGVGRDPSGFGPRHSRLDPGQSLVLSPFRLGDHAAPHNGRRRDHLTAALADVVIAMNVRPGGEIERVCFQALDAGQCVLVWLGEHHGLIAAGAQPLDHSDLELGLRRFALKPHRNNVG